MLHKEFWGLLFLAFVGYVFFATSPSERMGRVCSPIDWVGNASTSLTALVTPQYQFNVQNAFDKVDYGCQFLLWRMFYQAEYNKYLEEEKQKEAFKTETAPLPAAPTMDKPQNGPGEKATTNNSSSDISKDSQDSSSKPNAFNPAF